MEYLILLFALLAILHFVYEGILAPSYRLEYAYQVFRLRDQLRMLKIERGREFPEKQFQIMQDSMNGILRNIELIDIVMLRECQKKIAEDKEFRARVEERLKVLEACQLDEVKAIRDRSARIVERVLSVNNGAWGFYLLPIGVAFICYQKTAQMVKCIATLSEPDIEKVAHAGTTTAKRMKLAA